MDKNTFTVINNEGKETTCYVLFTFDSEETNKSYVVYTDNTTDSEGKIQVYASIYKPEEERITTLEPITTDKEWKIIETILSTLQDEIRNNAQGNTDTNNGNNEQ